MERKCRISAGSRYYIAYNVVKHLRYDNTQRDIEENIPLEISTSTSQVQIKLPLFESSLGWAMCAGQYQPLLSPLILLEYIRILLFAPSSSCICIL